MGGLDDVASGTDYFAPVSEGKDIGGLDVVPVTAVATVDIALLLTFGKSLFRFDVCAGWTCPFFWDRLDGGLCDGDLLAMVKQILNGCGVWPLCLSPVISRSTRTDNITEGDF